MSTTTKRPRPAGKPNKFGYPGVRDLGDGDYAWVCYRDGKTVFVGGYASARAAAFGYASYVEKHPEAKRGRKPGRKTPPTPAAPDAP